MFSHTKLFLLSYFPHFHSIDFCRLFSLTQKAIDNKAKKKLRGRKIFLPRMRKETHLFRKCAFESRDEDLFFFFLLRRFPFPKELYRHKKTCEKIKPFSDLSPGFSRLSHKRPIYTITLRMIHDSPRSGQKGRSVLILPLEAFMMKIYLFLLLLAVKKSKQRTYGGGFFPSRT